MLEVPDIHIWGVASQGFVLKGLTLPFHAAAEKLLLWGLAAKASSSAQQVFVLREQGRSTKNWLCSLFLRV